jgi:competence protein ComGC
MRARARRFGRKGQTMVEYIIIVVLIAITLIVLFGKLSKATGKKVAGATSALDDAVGQEAQTALQNVNEGNLRNLQEDGTVQ